MDVILSRVGVSDAQLRQHCEAAVLDELQQADGRVQDAVAALQQALKVARASRELHQSLVLNASEQVQTSFRRLGASCNQIGPLLRLLHRDMGATASEQPAAAAAVTQAAEAAAAPTVSASERPETKPAAPQSPDASASPTASEYELSSEGEEADDDEPEVVEVTPPRSSKKRKAATLDLSRSPPPAARRKTLKEDTHTVRNYLADRLEEVQALPADGYSVATHNKLATYVRKVFAAADTLDDWQPRDDPTLARLLDEMEKRMGAFKESVAQLKRCKAVSDWRKEMTASAFVPSLDLVSMPPKILSSWSFADVSGCETLQDLRQVALPVRGIVSKTYTDASDGQEKRKKYFLPLLEATTKFFAAVAATDSSAILLGGANQCNYGLRLLRDLAARDDTDLSYQECVRLEELLSILRLVLHKVAHFRTKAANLVPGIVKLFPQAVRPSFSYPAEEPKQSKQQKKDQSKQVKKKKKKKRKKHQQIDNVSRHGL